MTALEWLSAAMPWTKTPCVSPDLPLLSLDPSGKFF
jgi:hypothetical protein